MVNYHLIFGFFHLPFAWLLQAGDEHRPTRPPICGGFSPAPDKPNIKQIRIIYHQSVKKVKKQTNKQTNWSSLLGFIELHGHLLGKSFFDEGSGIDFEN